MKTRKHYNKIVKTLAELYDRRYDDVLALYNKMEGNIEHTKNILNMSKSKMERSYRFYPPNKIVTKY